jgi:glycosyltransferase involved in cell wall biosynthesis
LDIIEFLKKYRMEKTISCVLTTHNKENMIGDVCKSLIDNFSEFVNELIIVFDGCTDNTENIVNDVTKLWKKNLRYCYTNDVFELKANNEGLKMVSNNFVVLVQDDMIIMEKDFDKRMLKPFYEFNDVFAVTSQTAHDNLIVGDTVITTNSADRRLGYSRDRFAVREIANRGPLMYNYSDIVKLNFFDEFLCPNSYDDHDISYRAYKILNKVSGLYWIDYESEPSWGTGRQKNQHIHENAHRRNSKIIVERHHDIIGKIKNEDRILI